MDSKALLEFLAITEKLKCNLRHSWTSSMRQESVAEHSWRLAVFSWLLRKDFPDYNMEKVLLMCLFHDLGEAVTGDIPTFLKNQEHEDNETEAINKILGLLDVSDLESMLSLFNEIRQQDTKEARLFKALDKLEAVIQHNEAPISSWIPLEYELNLTYGDEESKGFPVLADLRSEIRNITQKMISESIVKKLEEQAE
ncbi:MAG: HD domain-containing protein [Ruminiclostridium sp.]|nr:HD domain-containing protein [Ruminiclostridium sp.]